MFWAVLDLKFKIYKLFEKFSEKLHAHIYVHLIKYFFQSVFNTIIKNGKTKGPIHFFLSSIHKF